MMRDQVPVVLVNRLAGVPAPAVVSDDAAGIGQAVAHLRGLGHVAIGHISGPARDLGDLDPGATPTARRCGTPARRPGTSGWCGPGSYTAAAGGRPAWRCWPERRSPRSWPATTWWRWAVTRRSTRRDCGCPADISLVGINDMPLAGWMRPSLTTVAIPQEELGMRAAQLIVERIDDPARAGAGRLAADRADRPGLHRAASEAGTRSRPVAPAWAAGRGCGARARRRGRG